MTTYLLDTNIIIDAIHNKRNWNASLVGLVERGHTLACCAINIAEVYAGRLKRRYAPEISLFRSGQ